MASGYPPIHLFRGLWDSSGTLCQPSASRAWLLSHLDRLRPFALLRRYP